LVPISAVKGLKAKKSVVTVSWETFLYTTRYNMSAFVPVMKNQLPYVRLAGDVGRRRHKEHPYHRAPTERVGSHQIDGNGYTPDKTMDGEYFYM